MSFGKFDPRTLGVKSEGFEGLGKVSEELAKIRPETMANFASGIKNIGEVFGGTGIGRGVLGGLQSSQRQLGAQISFGIQSAMQPYTNQMSAFVNRVSNASQPFFQRNAIGAGAGGLVGSIIGSFIPVPGATIALGALGAFVGAGFSEGLSAGGGGGSSFPGGSGGGFPGPGGDLSVIPHAMPTTHPSWAPPPAVPFIVQTNTPFNAAEQTAMVTALNANAGLGPAVAISVRNRGR